MKSTQLRAYDAPGLGHKLVPVEIKQRWDKGEAFHNHWNSRVHRWHRGKLA